MLNRILKLCFFGLIAKPLTYLVLGLNIRNKPGLPNKGAAVILANHNSHLDTLVLMSLFPLRQIHRVRPVAAADYFLKNRYLAWFALNVIGIIPLARSGMHRDLFNQCHQALSDEQILIIYPEGSRGKAEQLGKLKTGTFHLLKDRPEIPVIPIMLHGLGMALPKGTALLLPYNCDVVIGSEIPLGDDRSDFIQQVGQQFEYLAAHCLTRHD